MRKLVTFTVGRRGPAPRFLPHAGGGNLIFISFSLDAKTALAGGKC